MTQEERLIRRLKRVALLLGDGWRYNAIFTSRRNINSWGHDLTNGAGLIINVCRCDGSYRWTLQYKHPKHGHVVNHAYIGCSLDKRLESIVNDVKRRLLSQSSNAYKALQHATEKATEEKSRAEYDDHMFTALDKVLRLHPFHNHRYLKSFCINNADDCTVASIHQNYNAQTLKLTLNDITPEQLIQIIQIAAPSGMR